MNVKEKKI